MNTPDWHTAALHDLEHSTMSLAEIAAKYGRAPDTVKKLLHQSKIVRRFPNTRRGPKRVDNGVPISPQHHVIGIRINLARGGEGIQSFANKIGVSPLILAQMEVGQHDFKFSQLIRIATATGKTVPQLMESFTNNLYQQGRPNARH